MGGQLREHALGVHGVLVTAERDDADSHLRNVFGLGIRQS
jgi:hypothetical protein